MKCPARRSWKGPEGVAAAREFLAQKPPRRAAIRDLMRAVLSSDPFVRRCATDLARRVSARQPGVLGSYAGVFIDLMEELPAEEWQARGYCALAAAWNAVSHDQQMRVAAGARRLVEDRRIALRAIGVEAFATLGAAVPELHDEAVALLEQARQDETAALRCRARRMLPLLLACGDEGKFRSVPRPPSPPFGVKPG